MKIRTTPLQLIRLEGGAAEPPSPEAPAAPAAPAPSPAAQPAAAAVEGVLDDIEIEDDPSQLPAAPEMDEPIGEVDASEPDPEAEPETPEEDADPKPDPAAKKDGEDQEPEPAPAEEPSLLGEQFKTRKAVEVAYINSSKEGRRLAKELQTIEEKHNSAVAKKDQEISFLKAQLEAGPKPPELTDEELDALTPSQLIRHQEKIRKYEENRKEIERKNREEKERVEAAQRELSSTLSRASKAMSEDSKRYPGYQELTPVMDSLMDYAPDAFLDKNGAQVLYYAALGYRELQKIRAASGKSKAAQEEARRKAESDAQRGGGTGPAPKGKSPAGGGGKSPSGAESDEEFNNRQIQSYVGSKSKLFR